MLAFAPSLVTLGVALVSLAASQPSPGLTTESERLNFTMAGTVAENGISSETTDSNNTIMSNTMSYTNASVTATPWMDQIGNKTEGASTETTPAPMPTSYIYSTKMTEKQSTNTAKPYIAKGYDTTGILILILIIVVAIGFGIACYISKRRGKRYAVDFSTRPDEASVPLSPVEPMLANVASAPHNGLQTFESGERRSKEEGKEREPPKHEEDGPKAEAESASPPADDSQNKAQDAEPVKPNDPDQQISDGTVDESPKNENNSNNSDDADERSHVRYKRSCGII